MAKRPVIETLEDGYDNTSRVNLNFQNIRDQFDAILGRQKDTPNFMEVDLDVADANLTNTNVANVSEAKLNGVDLITALTDNTNVVVCLGGETLTAGDILYYDEDFGCLKPLPLGEPGQVLKAITGKVAWRDDIDTDTDTIGVNVYENGELRGENVRTIDFLGGDGAAGTGVPAENFITGAGDSWSFNLNAGVGCLFEDTRVDDTPITGNIGGEQLGSLPSGGGNVTVYDLIADGGFSLAQINAGTGLELYVELGWTHSPAILTGSTASIYVTFVQNDGTTVVSLFEPFQGNTTDLIVNLNGTTAIPAGTRYIRTSYIIAEGLLAGVTLSSMERKICYA